MSTAHSHANPPTNGPGQAAMANGLSTAPPKAAVGVNGIAGYGQETRPAPPPPGAAPAKNGKGKQKKGETDQELLLKKISELEQSKKGERGETEELGGYSPSSWNSFLCRAGRSGATVRCRHGHTNASPYLEAPMHGS